MYVVVVAVLAFGIYAFIQLTGFQAKWMTSKTTRTAESMYDKYADPRRKRGQQRPGQGSEPADDSAGGPGDKVP
jgi:hypothetical protein